MFRSVVIAMGVALLSGCVSTKIVPIKESDVATLQGGAIAITTREKPAFAVMTAGKAMFGAIGGAAMVIAGNNLIKENSVEDPAVHISNELIKGFAETNAMTVVPTGSVIATTMKPAELAKQYPNADVLLDVQTVNWSFAYFPMDWNSYHVIYSAKVRVIDVKKSKLLAEGFCSRVPEKTDSAPSYDQLVQNGAAGLKKELAIAAEHCIKEFRSKVFLQSGVRTANSAR
jgi:hypothetical protein